MSRTPRLSSSILTAVYLLSTTGLSTTGLSATGGAVAQTYPPSGTPQTTFPQGQQAPTPMRQLFANTLAAVIQGTGTAAVSAVGIGLTGAITNWLDRKQQKPPTQGYGVQGYSPQAYPETTYPDNNYPSNSSDPSTGYPGTGTDDSTGYPSTGYPGSDSDTGSPELYAGVAYEVHVTTPDGQTIPVDPASYIFRTGDRFRVYYRPSLPGRVEVFNVNAAGQTSHIDTADVAAGELASLGPYEFAAMTGNETLLLQLNPCSSAAMITTTRNIVKVQDGSNGSGLRLSSCGGPQTRGLAKKTKTRDIRKVAVEQGTAFALDPLSSGEMSSGDIAARQVTLTMMHR